MGRQGYERRATDLDLANRHWPDVVVEDICADSAAVEIECRIPS